MNEKFFEANCNKDDGGNETKKSSNKSKETKARNLLLRGLKVFIHLR